MKFKCNMSLHCSSPCGDQNQKGYIEYYKRMYKCSRNNWDFFMAPCGELKPLSILEQDSNGNWYWRED
jgi:hypothetical protein